MSSIDEMSRKLAEAMVKETAALRKKSERGEALTQALMELGWTPPWETPQTLASGDVRDAVKALPPLERQDGRRHRVVVEVTTESRTTEKEAAALVRVALQRGEQSDRFRHSVTKWECKGFRRVLQGLRREDQ